MKIIGASYRRKTLSLWSFDTVFHQTSARRCRRLKSKSPESNSLILTLITSEINKNTHCFPIFICNWPPCFFPLFKSLCFIHLFLWNYIMHFGCFYPFLVTSLAMKIMYNWANKSCDTGILKKKSHDRSTCRKKSHERRSLKKEVMWQGSIP